MTKKSLEKLFDLPAKKLKEIIRKFQSEMDRGLTSEPSSLKMIPAYVDIPTGNEKGSFLALDLGGTNFRILEIELKGGRKASYSRTVKYALDKRHITGSASALFDYLAASIEKFIRHRDFTGTDYIGFTFSFPVAQTGVSRGSLVSWTKGFDIKGAIGKDVVILLEEALSKHGVDNLKVAALVNDTVGTLAAGAYKDPYCDIGVIVGTGTNACYLENVANIAKWNGPAAPGAGMIINIEWGNFNKIAQTQYDIKLDRQSNNPGKQLLEKMASGMYIGEIVRLVLTEPASGKSLLGKFTAKAPPKPYSLKAEHMSSIESDRSEKLAGTGRLLKNIGMGHSNLAERRVVRDICDIVSRRAARLVASCITAIILKKDPNLLRRHTVAIDGSVYEKHPAFSKNMRGCIKELLGKKRSSRVKIVLTKDGSGKGAAIIAAIASARFPPR